MNVEVIRHGSDRRPESWTPLFGTISPDESVGTGAGWAARRALIEELGEVTMCELVARNRGGSGPGVPSLGVVRPVEPPGLLITERNAAQLKEWHRRAKLVAGRLTLFDDPPRTKPEFEVVPQRFRYRYRCQASGCPGHKQTIVDWEIVALWSKVRGRPDATELMRAKFQTELWDGRDTVLFVGNQEQYPGSFLVLGIFWPPVGPLQGVLGV